MAAAFAASEEQPSGTAPGAFHLPPYKQARPTMCYKQAESLMDMRNITNPAFRLVLVQSALSDGLQESVANRTYQLDRYRNIQYNNQQRLCVD